MKEGQVDYISVVCPTSDLNDSYNFVNPDYRHTVVTRALLQKIIRYQSSPNAGRMLLILDDCIGSLNFNHAEVSQLFTTYRHLKCTIMLSSQYIYKVPPLIRECAKYAFLFAQRTMRSMEALFDSYGASKFSKKNEFIKFLRKNTENYNTLLYIPPEDKYIQYKAPAKIPRFRVKQ